MQNCENKKKLASNEKNKLMELYIHIFMNDAHWIPQGLRGKHAKRFFLFLSNKINAIAYSNYFIPSPHQLAEIVLLRSESVL